MRRAIRLLVVGLFAVLVVVPAGQVASAGVSESVVGVVALDQPSVTPTAPTGPELNPEQEASRSRQKLIIGVIAAVLLVIVFFGRRSHNKRRKKLAGATVK